MLEEVTYDNEGHITSAGADRYKIPSVADIPKEFNVYLLKDSGNPKAIYSSKVGFCLVQWTSWPIIN